MAILAFLPLATAEAAFPGANGRIAYTGKLPGESVAGIVTVRPDGSGARRLNEGGLNPSWSADGRRLAFNRTIDDSTSGIFTMNADGGDETPVAVINGVGAGPSFSPSGNRIAYTTGLGIRTIRADGTRPRVLVRRHPRGSVGAADYAPDGERIVFGGVPEGKSLERPGIWSVRRDGSQLRRLTDPMAIDEELGDANPDFRPDGRRILFTRVSNEGFRAFVMRPDGSRERELPLGYSVLYPVYAPDGKRIAGGADSSVDQTGCTDLFSISLTRLGRRQLTHNCGGGALPSWQPLPGPRRVTPASAK